MKRQFIHETYLMLVSIMLLFCASSVMAQTSITVEKAGTLSTLLSDTETTIKVSGPLNGTDFKYLRNMVTNKSLTSIDLTDAKVVSGGDAYYDGRETIDDEMPAQVFYECKKLTACLLPNSITTIGTNAFARSGLKKIDIPNTVTKIGNDAFAYCSSLLSVVIGKKVSRLEQGVFYSSPVTNAYFKPLTPPNVATYEFSSSPRIHVYASVLSDYKATNHTNFGTIVGDLEKTYPYEKDADELAADQFAGCFDDVLCTQLKSEYAAMSDEELTAQLTAEGMASDFMAIVLKIKNDKWAAYEKYFRIHAYKAYSDAAYWNGKMKSNGGSYMGNPTGIYSKEGENLYVFVGDDIPSDATLYLVGSIENAQITSATAGKKLTKGLNVVPGTANAIYYVLYTANTKAMTKKLTEWPLINIHIEGGVVNGYYELSRHSDAEYKAILSKATYPRFTVKGDESLFHFKTATYKSVWPTTIDRSICWFDSLTVWQKELMGFCESVALGQRDFYPHNLKGGEAIFPIYYNNPNFAIEGEAEDAGWANATAYRTSFNTEACVRSTFDLENTASLDDWCANHECGHQNQSTISLEGCTEVSNNLFANMVRFIDGLVTSTGTSNTSTMDDFAERKPFYFRSVNARIHMYYQLYLYYHLARKNTAFFPTLFQELRKSPLTLYQSGNNNNGSLKFIRLACKVAGEDLSDFFRAWGFFEAGRFEIEDYGAHVVTVRQTDIDKTLAEISQYPKNREILFIEDRVKDVLSTGFPTTPGQKRRESEKIGQYGNIGQFTDYLETPTASSYTYAQTDSLFYMNGTGGVGFIVLDNEDNILYGSNNYAFRLPSSIGVPYNVYSMDNDGTLHVAERDGEALQVITTEKVGTLQNVMKTNIAGVKINGPINGIDLKTIRNTVADNSLFYIDLSNASIRTGGTYTGSYSSVYNAIGNCLFYQFPKLTYIQLPETLTRIYKQAFSKSGLRSVVIPNKVTAIDGDAFAYCDDLTEVVIGEKVKTLGQGVFYSSPIKDVYVKPLTPPSISIYQFSSNPVIHVHKASLAKYQASSWAEYGTIVDDLDEWEEEIANGIVSVRQETNSFDVEQSEGQLAVSGLADNTLVTVHAIDGTLIAETTVSDGTAKLDLNACQGKVVVISAGSQHQKVYVKH